MSAMSDAIITYAILRKFVTPIIDSPAYKLGLVDDTGRPTKKSQYDKTESARDAYTLLDRFVFKLKQIVARMPAAVKLLGSYAAALEFIKEDADDSYPLFEQFHPNNHNFEYWNKVLLGEETVKFQDHFIVMIAESPSLLTKLVEAYEAGTQDIVAEEMGAAIAGGGEPSGNTVSQVQGLATEPVISKKTQKKWVDKNKGRQIEILQ